MLETRITTIVLTGKVGQMNPVLPSLKGVKRSMEIKPEIEEASGHAVGTSKNGHHGVIAKSHKSANPKERAHEVQSTKIEETTVRSAGSSKDGNHDVARRPGERTKSKNKAGRKLAKGTSTCQWITHVPLL